MSNHQQAIFELTFVKKSSNKRPMTSSIKKFGNDSLKIDKKYSQNDPWIKMKQLKAQAKQTQQQYLQMLTNYKQTQKQITQNYKEVQRRKVNFLKLYETKKLKNLSINMEKECKTQRQQRQQKIKEQVRHQKLEQQIKRLITKQEKQTYLEKLRQNLQKEKDKFKDKRFLRTKQLFNMSRNSFLNIKKSHDESKERKNQMKSVSDVRSKHFYWKRISEEIQILEEYQKIIKDLEQYENFEAQRQIRAQTSHTARTSKTGFFITQKK